MSFLSKILSGFQGAFNWLVKTRVNVNMLVLLIVVLLAAAAGSFLRKGNTLTLPSPGGRGKIEVPVGNESLIVDPAVANGLAEPKIETSSKVKTRSVTLPGEPVLDSKILEVFPDVWFEKEFSFDNGDVYLVKYNPARNEWKFKDYTVQETVTKTVFVPAPTPSPYPLPGGEGSLAARESFGLQLGYKRVWEYNLASVGVNYEYGFSGWKWFGGVKGEYNFGLKKFQPALESGIILHF